MKVLYLELGMGAAGDMLTAALAELLPDKEAFFAELNSIGIPEVSVAAERAVKCGITGTHVSVKVHGEEEGEHGHECGNHEHVEYRHECGTFERERGEYDHVHEDHAHSHGEYDHAHEDHAHGKYDHSCGTHEHEYGEHRHEHVEHDHTHAHSHRSLAEVQQIIDGLAVSARVKTDAMEVYQLIAEAESYVHGRPVPEIHFHEVGTMDAIADVVAVSLLIEKLSPEQIMASPVHVGSGQVHCAHGILPVPAPATAYILRGIPTYGGSIRGELCTPTGAALLKHFVSEYGSQPVMAVQAIGYGMGKKDFEAANCVRALLGEKEGGRDTVYELSCNVDDMTAERIAFAVERLFEAGAREVFTQPVAMKKGRPGTLFRVLCAEADRETMVREIFKHTTTIGIRENVCGRYILERTIETVDTPWGQVRRKDCSGYGVTRSKYEYDDLARIAREQNISLEEAAGKVAQSAGPM